MRNNLAIRLASRQRKLMQKPFQLARPQMSGGPVIVCASLLALLFPGEPRCDSYASQWAPGPKSVLRLIAAGGGPPGRAYRAGVEIHLDPGAFTYWRSPGAAGIAPAFSFAGSENAAGITIAYPVPVRIAEEGLDMFGYRGDVVFPLQIEPQDAARPVRLVLNLAYGVCAGICLPGKAEAELTLSPGSAGGAAKGAEASLIAAADALVPVRLSSKERDAKIEIVRDGNAFLPTWRLSLRQGSAKDLFAEAPEGWYFETKVTHRPNEFMIVEVERPRAADGKRPAVNLVLKNEPESYEFTVDLDAVAAKEIGSPPAP